MMKMVNIYHCSGCGLEVALTPPVERPCPNCGGEFVAENFFGRDRNLYTPVINRIVSDNFDTLIDEMESYLEEQALNG